MFARLWNQKHLKPRITHKHLCADALVSRIHNNKNKCNQVAVRKHSDE